MRNAHTMVCPTYHYLVLGLKNIYCQSTVTFRNYRYGFDVH